MMEWTHVQAVLEDYAEDYKQRLIDRLIRDDRYVTGDLIASIDVVPAVTDTELSVWLLASDTLAYINYGTKAHWPPPEPIIKWIEDKGIQPKPDANGKLPTVKGLAFLIGRAMAGKSPNQSSLHNPEGGMVADPVIQEITEQMDGEYGQRIEEAVTADIEENMRAILYG